ncbi:MAG: Crp/Fnr family transcriptional regulator [Pirellulaceae bacterium]|nr:Crp/Fnr family transcriptional regulator [Pirellulaceae bacterium]
MARKFPNSRSILLDCERRCNLRCLFDDADAPPPGDGPIPSVKREDCEPGEGIFRTGDRSEAIVVIRFGLVKLVDYSPTGSERILLLAGRGNAIGLDALLNKPMRHDAVSIRPTSICRIPVRSLEQLAATRPDLHLRLMSFWQDSLAFAEQSLSGFSCGPTPARIARLILFRAAIEKSRKTDEITLLHRQDMAAILGVSPENISRAIAKLKREKSLRKLKRDVYQCNLARMRELATGSCE